MRSTAGVLALLATLVACDDAAPPSSDGPAPVATVETAVVARGQVEETLETLGRVELDPKQVRTVAFVNAGQVRQVLVSPGQGVAAATPLLTLGPLPDAGFEVRQARIDLDFARRELERLERMRASRLATNEQVQQAEKAVSTAEAVLASLGGSAPDDPAAATRAPVAGIVSEVLVTAGAVVKAGEPAVRLAPTTGVVVRAGFEPGDLAALAVGLPATLEPVLGSDREAAVAGVLAELHRVVDPETQLVEAILHAATVPAWVLPGTTVRVRVAVRSADDTLLVPRAALLARDGGQGVFVVEDGHARWTPIALGIEGRDVVEARGNVAAGDRVATTGRSVLSDGMAVKASAEAAP